jgi:hypothetical protein
MEMMISTPGWTSHEPERMILCGVGMRFRLCVYHKTLNELVHTYATTYEDLSTPTYPPTHPPRDAPETLGTLVYTMVQTRHSFCCDM